MYIKTVYSELTSLCIAIKSCQGSGNAEWECRHRETLQEMIDTFLPHGSGIDSDVKIDINHSNDSQLVIYFDYHCMDENGCYDGWINYRLRVYPSLISGVRLSFTRGRDYHGLKDYLYEIWDYALTRKIDVHTMTLILDNQKEAEND